MSFIHYKLITNKNFEKITFDGVSLSVYDLKKIILDKKFRKYVAAPNSQNGPTGMSTGSMPNKKSGDVDLEVTNADTNEVYKKDGDLIPKNSRVRINRVVKSIGPAIAGGKVITSTQKQKEQLVNLRQRFNNYATNSPNASPVSDFGGNGDTKSPKYEPPSSLLSTDNIKSENSIYSDFMVGGNDEEENSNSNSSNMSQMSEGFSNSPNLAENISPLVGDAYLKTEQFNKNRQTSSKIKVTIPSQQILKTEPEGSANPAPPSSELLCPFMDETNSLHLMNNPIIVPCCGYFISCEHCIKERLTVSSFIECPHAGCIQDITSNHRLTSYKPISKKIAQYLLSNPSFLKLEKESIPVKMVTIKSRESLSSESVNFKTENKPSFIPVKLIISPKREDPQKMKLDNLEIELTVEDTDQLTIKDLESEEKVVEDKIGSMPERSGSLTPVSSRSRTVSNSSSTSSGSLSNTSKTPLSSESLINNSQENSREQVIPSAEQKDGEKDNKKTKSSDEIDIYGDVETSSIPKSDLEPSLFLNPPVLSLNPQNFNQNTPPPQLHTNVQTNQLFNPGQEYFQNGQQQQGFYNNNQGYIGQEQAQQMNIGYQGHQNFNNFSKVLAPPPGTDTFLQSHGLNGQQNGFHVAPFQDQRGFNHNFQPQFQSHNNLPPNSGPNGQFIPNQGFQNMNPHYQNQFPNQGWNPNMPPGHQLPPCPGQLGVISAPISIPYQNRHYNNNYHPYQRHNNYQNNRHHPYQSNSYKSRSDTKHRSSRTRSRSKRRSTSKSKSSKKHSNRSYKSRSRSHSRRRHRSRTRSGSRSKNHKRSSTSKRNEKDKKEKKRSPSQRATRSPSPSSSKSSKQLRKEDKYEEGIKTKEISLTSTVNTENKSSKRDRSPDSRKISSRNRSGSRTKSKKSRNGRAKRDRSGSRNKSSHHSKNKKEESDCDSSSKNKSDSENNIDKKQLSADDDKIGNDDKMSNKGEIANDITSVSSSTPTTPLPPTPAVINKKVFVIKNKIEETDYDVLMKKFNGIQQDLLKSPNKITETKEKSIDTPTKDESFTNTTPTTTLTNKIIKLKSLSTEGSPTSSDPSSPSTSPTKKSKRKVFLKPQPNIYEQVAAASLSTKNKITIKTLSFTTNTTISTNNNSDLEAEMPILKDTDKSINEKIVQKIKDSSLSNSNSSSISIETNTTTDGGNSDVDTDDKSIKPVENNIMKRHLSYLNETLNSENDDTVNDAEEDYLDINISADNFNLSMV